MDITISLVITEQCTPLAVHDKEKRRGQVAYEYQEMTQPRGKVEN